MSDSLKYKVMNMEGKEVGTIDLDPAVFGAPVKDSLVHDTVRWQLAKRRSGTHSTLTKGAMKGGGKKPWRQKGTGRARAGTINSPLWVGGGVAHGPHPRKYGYRLLKSTRKQALLSVLSEKVTTQKLVILDDLSSKDGKTKAMAAMLKKLGIAGKKAAFIIPKENHLVWRSSRNIETVLPLSVDGVNVYDLLRFPYLVSSKASIEALSAKLTGADAPKAEKAAKAPKKAAAAKKPAKKSAAKK